MQTNESWIRPNPGIHYKEQGHSEVGSKLGLDPIKPQFSLDS